MLGPTSFNLYVNGIFIVSRSLKLVLFADDANVVIVIKSDDYNEPINVINTELNKFK